MPLRLKFEPCSEKTVLGVSDQVQHKPGCTDTEDGKRPEIMDLVFNPIMVEGYAALFSCTAVVQASDSMTASM